MQLLATTLFCGSFVGAYEVDAALMGMREERKIFSLIHIRE